MHYGVRELVRWTRAAGKEAVDLRPPASETDLDALEQHLGTPLPQELRMLLTRFDGGELPSGALFSVRSGDKSIQAAVDRLAAEGQTVASNPDLPIPFFETEEGSVLVFDRQAAPVPDAWPVLDYDFRSGSAQLVHRTLDGWCRMGVSDWTSPDYGAEFSVDTYRAKAERHVAIEPDVSIAHATLAHAGRRAGEPVEALSSYLRAGRCMPAVPWCDWEALKLAVLLGKGRAALEAASRVAARGPEHRWQERETDPVRVAWALARLGATQSDKRSYLRLIDQARGRHEPQWAQGWITAARKWVLDPKEEVLDRAAEFLGWAIDPGPSWEAWEEAYRAGTVRDEHLLLLAPSNPFLQEHDPAALLRIRRDF